MKRNIININSYKYLVEYYDADKDMTNSQHYSEFVMLRNFNVMNNIVYDTDIYFIERNLFYDYIKELKENNSSAGESISFPVTNLKVNAYSNSYLKFNDNFNNNVEGINSSLYSYNESTDSFSLGSDVYEIYGIENNKLYNKKIKCDKFRIYHPITKRNINAIVDISNYMNNIYIHYVCRPINLFATNSETEIKYDNECYSEFVDVYFPNINDLFKINEDGTYENFYKEDFNIVASTRNEKFINSILSNSKELEHSEMYDDCQIVPLNLLIQPFRIIEEYNSESQFNYDDDLSNDDKVFVKLYLKTNYDMNSNYLSYPLTLNIYPYSSIDDQSKLYVIDESLYSVSISINNEFKFNLMSRLGFSDGIISVVSLFEYPNKSYFYSKYKDDKTTSPIKEAYKYYNNVDDHNYMMFVNEEIEKELEDVDNIDTLTDDMKKTVKEVANANYTDEMELLKLWKDIMKSTIINEYEEEFGTPGNFLGFKIEIATDIAFKHIIYDKNYRVNFNDIDDFAFKLNGIFERWEQRPEKLMVRCQFYDRILGIEIKSNLVIITKEWFKYLINDDNVHRLSNLSIINKNHNKINMNVDKLDFQNEKNILNDLKEQLINFPNYVNMIDKVLDNLTKVEYNKVNFINNINCIVNKHSNNSSVSNLSNINQRIIYKPVFYKVNNLQNISIRSGVINRVGINLNEYLSKVETFKLIIENKEYVEYGRNDIFVIFKINANDINSMSGSYNILNEDDEYISSGNWAKIN